MAPSKASSSCVTAHEIEKHTMDLNEMSTFVEETLDNRNYQVWLQQEDVANIAKIEYGWYGDRSNVLFEVIGSVGQLRAQLVHISLLKEKRKQSLTFIINLNNLHWVTLVIMPTVLSNSSNSASGHVRQPFTACYVDSLGEDLPQMYKDVLGGYYIEHFKVKQQIDGHNCGIFALENARIINEALQNFGRPQHKDILNLQLTDENFKVRRIEFALTLHWRKVIESKLNILLSFLGNLNERYSKLKDPIDFNYENANVFLLFLETLALEDQKLQQTGCPKELNLRKMYESKIWDTNIIADIALIQHIRTTSIIHRDYLSKFIPDHFWKIINYEKGNGVKRFFQDLKKIVQQIKMKLSGEVDDISRLQQSVILFKCGIENEKFAQIITHDKQMKNMVDFFRKATMKQSYDVDRLNLENANEMMFNLFVNIVPFIDEKNRNLVEPLKKLKEFRGNLFHEFYESGDNFKLMGIRLKNFTQNYRQHFFKYYFSIKVQSILRKVTPSDSEKNIRDNIEKILQDLQNEFRNQIIIVREEASNVQNQSKNDLETWVHEYFKLFSVIDNEETIRKRNAKYKESNVPARYVQFSCYDRRRIWDDFKHLQNFYKMIREGDPDSVDIYNEEKKLIFAKYKAPYGILKDDFNAMIESYVEVDDATRKKEDIAIEADVVKALFCLQEIKEHHSDLSNENIIGKFINRGNVKGNKMSPEEKIHTIPKGELKSIKIPVGKNSKTKAVSIDTDKFVQNIFEIVNTKHNENNLVFNNLKEAFSDDIFLDLLEKEHDYINGSLIEKLQNIDEMTPYVARLLTKDKLITKKIFTEKIVLKTMERLLSSDSYILIFKRFLKELSTNNTINGKKLKDILKPDCKDYDKSNIKPLFYEHIYNIIKKKSDIQNMECIFEEPEYTEGILSVLSQKIKQSKSSDTDIELTKNILKLLKDIANDLCLKGSREAYIKALELLDGKKGAQEARKCLIKNQFAQGHDLYILQTKRYIARIKRKQGEMETDVKEAQKLFLQSNNILSGIKEISKERLKEMNSPITDLKLLFLITLRDLAFIQHLLHDCCSAYDSYDCLFKYVLNLCNENLFFILSKNMYYRITRSKIYEDIWNFSRKLNILKIRSDMAYECRCLAEEYQKNLPKKNLSKKRKREHVSNFDEVKQLYDKALDIYEEVYEIQQKYPTSTKDVLKTQRDVAYVCRRLGHLMSFMDDEETSLDRALRFFERAKTMYEEIKENQVLEKWKEHPAVCRIEQFLTQTERQIAFVHNKLGDSKVSSNPQNAFQHYTEALKLYTKVLGYQKLNLDENHEYTLNTLSDVATTNNKLARYFKLQNDCEGALKHYDKARTIFEKVLEIQRNEYGDGHHKTEKTRQDLKLTKSWITKF